MIHEPLTPLHQPPMEVAPETFVIRSAQPALGAPLSVALNSVVIRGAEPALIDTGTYANRERWLEDVFSLVEPADVRWVIISHEDHDHTGNLDVVMDLCPKATIVTTWAHTERIANAIALPPNRLRWLHDGEQLDIGDRTLLAVQPPVYDGPATRGIHDPSTGHFWASDAFAAPMESEPVDTVAELPPPMWAEGFALFHHHALCPWLSMVDPGQFAASVDRVRRLSPTVISGAHTPVITSHSIDDALALLAALPDTVPPPHPDQHALEAALAPTTVEEPG